ncbi:HK97 gp10 family phage protein [Vagococcus fluvialis]|uniref:HK97 gp10 family phage protein n=1 Tax=Vagococcus fluvialis TaxID=2738 RepID=UPI0032E5155F
MANKNGFESAMTQLKTVAKINEKVAIGALEEAAEYFVSVLKPQLIKSNISKEHMVDALQVKIEKEKVFVYFDDFGWYWYLVEHGHAKANGKGRVKGKFTIKKVVNEEKKHLEKMMKESILKKM